MSSEDDFRDKWRQKDRIYPDVLPFPDVLCSPDAPMLNGASLESALTVRQHRVDRRSGRIKNLKPRKNP